MFIYWNFNQYIRDLLSHLLKKTRQVDWLTLINTPVIYLYNQLYTSRYNVLFDMQHNAQIASFEHLLNNKLQVLGKPILIGDTTIYPEYYIGQDDVVIEPFIDVYIKNGVQIEYVPNNVYIGKDDTNVNPSNEIYIGTDEYFNNQANFIVYVDFIDYNNAYLMRELRYLLDKYKLAGTIYTIQPY